MPDCPDNAERSNKTLSLDLIANATSMFSKGDKPVVMVY